MPFFNIYAYYIKFNLSFNEMMTYFYDSNYWRYIAQISQLIDMNTT